MQPVSGNNWTRVSGTAAGTTTVTDRAATLDKVFYGIARTGTVVLYDSASGTSSRVITTCQNAGNFTSMSMEIACKDGIVAVTSGTTDLVVVWR